MTERAYGIMSKVPGFEVTQVTEEMEAEELQQALLAKGIAEQKATELEQSTSQLQTEVSQLKTDKEAVIEAYKQKYGDDWKSYLLANGRLIHIWRYIDDHFQVA